MDFPLFEKELIKKEDKIAIEKNGIVLFESAYNKMADIVSNSDKLLRITLEPGGCSGLSYFAKLDTPIEDDVIIEFNEQVKMLVSDTKRFPSDDDPKILFSDWDFLKGLHLKYSENIMSSQFEMDNPNALRGCSCGISFKPKGYGGKPKSCIT